MRISELMEQLGAIQAEQGDIDVRLNDDVFANECPRDYDVSSAEDRTYSITEVLEIENVVILR